MPNKAYRVSIIGASGYTGSELARILINHPEVEIVHITSETHLGKNFSDLHPQFIGRLDMPLVSAQNILAEDQDVLFLALPHGVSMSFVKQWAGEKVKIIDLSGDFRLRNPKVYSEWYQKEHIYPEGFKNAVYGLPELHGERIAKASLVANPGCYPTASILSLAPLVAGGYTDPKQVIIDAKSGTTGAGVKPSETTHFSNVNENFRAYGIGTHRHTIEIEEQLGGISAEEEARVQFTPHLLPVDRGILATAYANILREIDQNQLTTLFTSFYKGQPFIRIRNQAPSIKDVRGSNFCDIFPYLDFRTGRVIVIAVIDNLVKGAAGQAVHNMNLMLGLDQTAGLMDIPIKP
ncbi:N-acetyl-gamma-glutamyl-phosphate reductase [Lunatibacter salilacus]|uniref:N-acetyl-gamma-glutamyl-phosphate reductase n=1 Tax=Lunatibacter salilacus TaxID=2483804 RepID=UPI00131B003B|nr:N-acetyl-gamma-glutamyl-phosphate reductase [Lunatibacter salilacus]